MAPLSEEQIRHLVVQIKQQLGPQASPELVREAARQAVKELEGRQGAGSTFVTSSDRLVVSVFGSNKPGILAGVSTVLADRNCNILDISQKIMGDLFTLIMLVDPNGAAGEEIRSALDQEARRLGVKIFVQNEALFKALHRP